MAAEKGIATEDGSNINWFDLFKNSNVGGFVQGLFTNDKQPAPQQEAVEEPMALPLEQPMALPSGLETPTQEESPENSTTPIFETGGLLADYGNTGGLWNEQTLEQEKEIAEGIEELFPDFDSELREEIDQDIVQTGGLWADYGNTGGLWNYTGGNWFTDAMKGVARGTGNLVKAGAGLVSNGFDFTTTGAGEVLRRVAENIMQPGKDVAKAVADVTGMTARAEKKQADYVEETKKGIEANEERIQKQMDAVAEIKAQEEAEKKKQSLERMKNLPKALQLGLKLKDYLSNLSSGLKDWMTNPTAVDKWYQNLTVPRRKPTGTRIEITTFEDFNRACSAEAPDKWMEDFMEQLQVHIDGYCDIPRLYKYRYTYDQIRKLTDIAFPDCEFGDAFFDYMFCYSDVWCIDQNSIEVWQRDKVSKQWAKNGKYIQGLRTKSKREDVYTMTHNGSKKTGAPTDWELRKLEKKIQNYTPRMTIRNTISSLGGQITPFLADFAQEGLQGGFNILKGYRDKFIADHLNDNLAAISTSNHKKYRAYIGNWGDTAKTGVGQVTKVVKEGNEALDEALKAKNKVLKFIPGADIAVTAAEKGGDLLDKVAGTVVEKVAEKMSEKKSEPEQSPENTSEQVPIKKERKPIDTRDYRAEPRRNLRRESRRDVSYNYSGDRDVDDSFSSRYTRSRAAEKRAALSGVKSESEARRMQEEEQRQYWNGVIDNYIENYNEDEDEDYVPGQDVYMDEEEGTSQSIF